MAKICPTQMRSTGGTIRSDMLWIKPVRGHVDSMKRLIKGDVYIGRDSRQRDLERSKSLLQGRRPREVHRDPGVREVVSGSWELTYSGMDLVWNSLGVPLHFLSDLPRRFPDCPSPSLIPFFGRSG